MPADDVSFQWARLRAAVLALALLAAALPARAASYPPELRFHTLVTERVSVHFHDGYEPLARQAAALAAELLAAHEARYGQKVGRVQLVLVDADDEPNGFASPLPYPLVTIRVASPTGSEEFGNHEGWLRLALSHELAHLVHLEQARGLWRLGRHVFGRAPFLFPNALAMSWMIEGLATYEETQLTAFGRGRNADSRMVLRMAALDRRFPGEDQAIYGLDAWPGGQTPYLFGEAFLRRLDEEDGKDTLPRLARQHAGQIIPFLDGRTLKKVTGSGLHKQWKAFRSDLQRQFEDEVRQRAAAGLTDVQHLTRRGIRQAAPRFSPDGSWIAYTSGTLTRFPQLRLVKPDGTGDHALALRNSGSGLAWTPDGRELVFSELQVHRTYSLFGDLSLVDVASGRVRRLTQGLRAYDPDVSSDGRTIVFARRLGDRSELFTIPAAGGAAQPLTRSVAGVEWSGPRFSPDGRCVAAARLLPGGWLDLVRIDLESGALSQLTHDRAADVEPTWTPDGGTIVFRSDRDGASNIYAVPREGGALVRLTNVLGGAFQPSVSPGGERFAFSDYSAAGYDVVTAPLSLQAAPPAPAYADTRPAPHADPLPAAAAVQPYHPASLLLPRFWTPWIEANDEEARLGIATGGSDPLSRHLWAVRGTYGTVSQRANGSLYYVYDRFRPTFALSAEETYDPFTEKLTGGDTRDALRRKRRLSLSASLPLRRSVRSVQALSVGYRMDGDRVLDGQGDGSADWQAAGIETAWTLSSARSYPYSISPLDGGRLTLAWLHAAPALGSDDSFEKLSVDGRYYRRVLGERDALAVQLRAGTTYGSPQFQPFAVGGYPDSGLFDPAANLAVLRGYPSNAFMGRRFAAANIEYRFPLFSPQRGWRSLPVFLRHLRGTVFADAGNAWSGSFRPGLLKRAAGASLGVDSALGFSLPATAELTVAHGFDEQGETRVYLRLGLAF